MRVTHAKTTAVVGLTDWNADHVIDGVAADDDPRFSDARTPTDHTHDYADPDHLHPHSHVENADAVHTHAYADPAHTHTLEQHSHTLEEHSHVHSHTAADVGAATTGHTHDLSAQATDAEVTAAIAAHVQAETHGGGATHTHTTQAAIANLTGSPTTTVTRDKINAILTALRAYGVINP